MTTIPSDYTGFRRWHDALDHVPSPDVRVVTSGGQSIPAHSAVLASASPVLESKLHRPHRHSGDRVVRILGVPCDAVVAFLASLYPSSSASLRSPEAEEAMEHYGVHLLVLSHAYRIPSLKRRCESGLAARLTADRVIDVLQLARQCDAPHLYLRCMRLIAKDFDSVQTTEAWRFLQGHDPRLELEILQYLQDADMRKKRRRRERAEQEVYQQLNEAMECLLHICTEGCTDVGPHDGEPPSKEKGPCTRFRTCEGLQQLIRHFATCGRKLAQRGSCPRCKRMWQLFRLHSSICDQPNEACRVPLCKQFKMRMEVDGKGGDDETWRLLVRKVAAARVMSTLVKRKRPDQLQFAWKKYRGTR